jgi:hypothetical protein
MEATVADDEMVMVRRADIRLVVRHGDDCGKWSGEAWSARWRLLEAASLGTPVASEQSDGQNA